MIILKSGEFWLLESGSDLILLHKQSNIYGAGLLEEIGLMGCPYGYNMLLNPKNTPEEIEFFYMLHPSKASVITEEAVKIAFRDGLARKKPNVDWI